MAMWFASVLLSLLVIQAESQLSLRWSSSAPTRGWTCSQWIEPSDPHTWRDNWLCMKPNIGGKWTHAGPIAGMRCTQILEPSDPHTWTDNYWCVPNNSPFIFRWSYAGPIAGQKCTRIIESADPNAWADNYLCWVYSPPKCTTPPTMGGGSFPGCRVPANNGARCTGKCGVGSRPSGQAICKVRKVGFGYSGYWTKPVCQKLPPKRCGAPPKPAAGTWKGCKSIASGGFCQLTCPGGYALSGNVKGAQCSNGKYIGLPSCKPRACGNPPRVVNGSPGCGKNVPSGGTCTISCKTGFTTTTTALRCSAGRWSVPAGVTCTEQSCKVPAPPTGATYSCATGSVLASRKTCKLNCAAGFKDSGALECIRGKLQVPKCHQVKPNDCNGNPPTTPSNGKWIGCNSIQSGNYCKLICNTGYTLTPANSPGSMCTNGNYGTAPTCAPKGCGNPPGLRQGTWGASGCTGGASGATCTATCNQGYGIGGTTPSLSIKCVAGKWVNSATNTPAPAIVCTVKGCTNRPALPSGVTFVSPCPTSAAHGTTCKIQCPPGQTAPDDVECYKGKWEMVQCVALPPKECDHPKVQPPNGDWDQDCNDVKDKGTCTIKCNDGYTKTGDATCNDGNWVMPAAPVCKPNGCSTDPPVPEYAVTPLPAGCAKGAASGFSCDFKCAAGFNRIDTIDCIAGIWNYGLCKPDQGPWALYCQCQANAANAVTRFGPRCYLFGTNDELGSFQDTITTDQFDTEFGDGNWDFKNGQTQVTTKDGKWVCKSQKKP